MCILENLHYWAGTYQYIKEFMAVQCKNWQGTRAWHEAFEKLKNEHVIAYRVR